MATNIEMPKLSDTMTEGTLVSWKVKVGDEVEIGDVIADIETDKATMEMEAFDEGIVSEILIEEGAKAPIGATLAILKEDGEEDSAPSQATAPAKTASATPSTPAQTTAQSSPVPTQAVDGSRIKASPLAKKIAASKGVDLSTIKGSGPGGRIVADDVNNAKTASPAAQSTPQTTSSTSAPQAMLPTVGSDDKVIPLSSMRKIIADRLLLSKQTVPHFYLHTEVDTAPLMELRKQINSQAQEAHQNKYSVNDFIVKALISASVAHPANVGVSVAIAVEDGLVTPVVKNAQDKTLLEISKEIKDMAKRAKEKKLKPNEFDGGTVTISNLGAWGIDSFDAIVNPPQAAILSVGGIIQKPVVSNGEIVVGQRMNLGLSCDHRVVDGAVAAGFLNELKRLIEKPSLMLM